MAQLPTRYFSYTTALPLGRVILFFLFLTVLTYAHVVFGFRSFFATDITTQNHGYRAWAANSLKNGELPAWCPLIFTGYPVIAESQAGVFYPFFLLFLILPIDYAYNIFIVMHYAIGAVLLFDWLRTRNISDQASFIVSCGFYFSSLLINYHVYPNHLSALVWLPLICASASHFSNHLLKGFFLISLIFSLQIFAGHIQFVWLTIFLGFLLDAFTLDLPVRARIKQIAVFWVAAPIFGVLLAAAQVLPTLEFFLNSQRYGPEFFYATDPSLQMRFLSQAFLPNSFGTLHNLTYSISGSETLEEMMNSFIGLPLLFLAAIALISRSTPNRLALAAVALIGIFLALGKNNPLYVFVWNLPVFSFFRYPNRYQIISLFVLLLFAGYGADALLAGKVSRRRIQFCFLMMLAGVGLSWLGSVPQLHSGAPLPKLEMLRKLRILDLVFVLTTLGALAIVVCRRRVHFVPLLTVTLLAGFFLGYRLQPTMKRAELNARPPVVDFLRQKETGRVDSYYDPYIEDNIYNIDSDIHKKYKRMRQLLCGDSNLLWAVPSTRGIYHPLIPSFYYKRAGNGIGWLLKPEILNQLGLRYYLTDQPLVGTIQDMDLQSVARIGEINIYESRHGIPRVQITGSANHETPRLLLDSNRKIVVECNATKPGVLVLRDLYYPGWKATVDGKHSQIIPVEGMFRGVSVDAGRHTVSFVYPATIVKWGILISCLLIPLFILLYRRA